MRAVLAGFALLVALPAWAQEEPSEPRKVERADLKKCSNAYLSHFRSIAWYYDFEGATALAKETSRPMFVIFTRTGQKTDPVTLKRRAGS